MAESAGKVWLYGNHGRLTYGIKQFIVDDESGISELPTDVHIGCSCFVVATGDIYVINSQHKWVKSISGNGSGDGGSSDDSGGDGGDEGGGQTPDVEDLEVIYDGGEVL